MTTYFGFALASPMFAGNCVIRRTVLTTEEATEIIEAGVSPCLNPSHVATIDAMRARYGISVDIPKSPPRVTLEAGDSLLVLGVRGLPRLTDRHEYTDEEIASATFEFVLYSVE